VVRLFTANAVLRHWWWILKLLCRYIQTPNAVGPTKTAHLQINLPSRLGTTANFQTVQNFCWLHLTRYGLVGLGIEFRLGWDFTHPSRPALGLTQNPVQYKDQVSFPGVKWPRRGNDHSPHLAPRSKKEYSYI